MRKRWYHLCRETSCAYHQLFLQAAEEVCLERSRGCALYCKASQLYYPGQRVVHCCSVSYIRHAPCPSRCKGRRAYVVFAKDNRFVKPSTRLQCQLRNKLRDARSRVPEFSIRHMAEAFEWPPEGGGIQAILANVP